MNTLPFAVVMIVIMVVMIMAVVVVTMMLMGVMPMGVMVAVDALLRTLDPHLTLAATANRAH